MAAQVGWIPVVVPAAGHFAGALAHRVRTAVERSLDARLTAGAVQALLAHPALLLLIDGASEVDEGTRTALRDDLVKLGVQRELKLILAGRDVAKLRQMIPEGQPSATYSLVPLNRKSRRDIATAHGIPDGEARVAALEKALGAAVDNPMLYAMALSTSWETVGTTRPRIYEQFLHGMAIRAGAHDPEFIWTAFGTAWSTLLESGQRAADRYTWMRYLTDALTRMERDRLWQGHSQTAAGMLDSAQSIGLLVRPDIDVGLAPLHDSFADYLAALAVAREVAQLPPELVEDHEEQVVFFGEIAGVNDDLANRAARSDPILACRLSALRQSRELARPEQVGQLMKLLIGDRRLPLIDGFHGIRLVHHPEYTAAILVEQDHDVIDADAYTDLAVRYPSWLLPARSDSLQVAVNIWASAVRAALRADRPLFQPPSSPDPDEVVIELGQYVRACSLETEKLLTNTLPDRLANRIRGVIGPRGIVAVVHDQEEGPWGLPIVSVDYRRSADTLIIRSSDPRASQVQPTSTAPADSLLRHHPRNYAGREILKALADAANGTWPLS